MEKQELHEGMIVLSTMGHDSGKVFMVVNIINKDFALIADGKNRLLDKPKMKRKKHLRPVSVADTRIMDTKELTDEKIARILKDFS